MNDALGSTHRQREAAVRTEELAEGAPRDDLDRAGRDRAAPARARERRSRDKGIACVLCSFVWCAPEQVRKIPHHEGEILRRLPSGTPVTAIGATPDLLWLKVSPRDAASASDVHLAAVLARTFTPLCCALWGACHPHGSFRVDVPSFTATIFSFSHFFFAIVLLFYSILFYSILILILFYSVSFHLYSLMSHLLFPKPFCTYPTDFCFAVELVCLPYNCLGVVTRFVSTCPSTHSRFAAHRSLASTSSSRHATASSRSRTSAARSA